MRSGWLPAVFSALVLMGCDRAPPPLTEARVVEQLRDNPDFVFRFETGPAASATTTCTPMPHLDESPRAAIAAGWIERRCVNNRIEFQLTAEGRRRSTHWMRHTLAGLANRATESPRLPRGPEDDDKEWTTWQVPVARFERSGRIDISKADRDARMRALIRGRWVLNDEGQLLRQAGWAALDAGAHAMSLFSLRSGKGGRYGPDAAWYLIELQPY